MLHYRKRATFSGVYWNKPVATPPTKVRKGLQSNGRFPVNVSPELYSRGAHTVPAVRYLMLWVGALLLSFASLFRYEFAGAAPVGVPPQLPTAFSEYHVSERTTLLFFLHPRCPCTAAGIAELNRVLSDYPAAFNTTILFPSPSGAPDDWVAGTNYEAASRLPGARLNTDDDALLSELLQITTSGTAVVYDRHGALLFHGGLTSSRGHEGANYGAQAIREIALGKRPTQSVTPVFGCRLYQSTSTEFQRVSL